MISVVRGHSFRSYNILCFFQSGIVGLSLRHCDPRTVIVQDLDPSPDDDDLYDRFARFGNINTCYIHLDDSGKSNGLGLSNMRLKRPLAARLRARIGQF